MHLCLTVQVHWLTAVWDLTQAAFEGKNFCERCYPLSLNVQQKLRNNTTINSFIQRLRGISRKKVNKELALFCIENECSSPTQNTKGKDHIPLCRFTVFHLKHKIRVAQIYPLSPLLDLTEWLVCLFHEKNNFKWVIDTSLYLHYGTDSRLNIENYRSWPRVILIFAHNNRPLAAKGKGFVCWNWNSDPGLQSHN